MTLSLCIPAYNAELYLPRLLQSAISQLIPFDEILVYNDCSTDKTKEVALEFGAVVIDGKENVGCSISKNKLAEHATSEWLFFIDADDELYADFTSVAHDWMKKNEPADIVLFPYRYIDHETKSIMNEAFYEPAEVRRNPVAFAIKNKIVNFELIRKAPFIQIGGFDVDPKILFIEDRAFAMKASLSGLSFDAEKKIACVKYYYPRSMSSGNMAKWPEAAYHLWKKVLKNTGDIYSSEIGAQLYENAIWAAKANAWNTVKKSIRLARKIAPRDKPNGSFLFQLSFKLAPFRSFYLRELAIRKMRSR